MNTGERIKKRRKEKGLTLEDLADFLGITKQTVQKYEAGIITNIPTEKIEQIAKLLNTSPIYLMCWEESDTIEKKSPAASAEDNNKYKSITDNLDKLNESGVEVADDYVEYLTKQDKYKKHHEPEHMEKEA